MVQISLVHFHRFQSGASVYTSLVVHENANAPVPAAHVLSMNSLVISTTVSIVTAYASVQLLVTETMAQLGAWCVCLLQ